VIEVGYCQLRARVEAAGDYRAAVAAHDAFVDGVVAAAFLDVRNLQVRFGSRLEKTFSLRQLPGPLAAGTA
jgi:hypothetical protein